MEKEFLKGTRARFVNIYFFLYRTAQYILKKIYKTKIVT